jgi:PAS domain S-box-containing protein
MVEKKPGERLDKKKSYVKKKSSIKKSSLKSKSIGISERKQVEESLRVNEEKLRSIIEHSNEVFFIHDTKHQLTYSSPQSKEIFGYTSEEMMVKWTTLVTDNPINEKGIEITERAIKTGIKQEPYLLEIKRKDGELRIIEINESPIKDSKGKVIFITGAVRDITERKKSEEELKAKEKNLSLLIESSPDCICHFSLDGRFISMNAAGCRLNELDSTEVIIGESFTANITENLEAVKDAFNRALKGKTVSVQYQSVNRSGRKIWWDSKVTPVRGTESEIISILRVSRDITERKKAEEIILYNERFLSNIFDSIQDGISILDKDMRIVRVNSAMEKWYQHSMPLVGKKCHHAYHGTQEECKVCPTRNTFNTGESSYEIVPKTGPKGQIKGWLDLYAFPIFNEKTGEITGVIEYVRDITERKKAEELLRDSEERFKRLIGNAPIAMSIINIDGTIEYTNEKHVEVTGYKKEDNFTLERWWKSVYPDEEYRKDVISKWNAYINNSSTGEEAGIHERRLACKDGVIKDIELQFTRVGDKVIVVFNDITERKKLEEQLRHSQKMEAVGQLAGGVAHDFNNILNVIIGYGDIMRRSLEKDNPLSLNLDTILSAADRAAFLTQSLLAFSRKQIIHPQPINLNEIVTKVEKFLLRVIGEDIKLKTICAEEDITVMADSGQIEQVLMNLATNARDAMPEGGMLVIETGIEEISEEYTKAHDYGKPGKYAHISVTDSGEGMDEETMQRIFEPFYTTKEVGKGTGLGLSMVYGIIKQHDGIIDVYSELKKGTKIKIYLPVVKAEVKETEKTELSSVEGGTETVLVAEDDEAVRRLSREILEKYGYTVIEAGNGEEAIEKFKENKEKINILLLDVIMPKKNGKKVYEEIKRIKPDIKAFFLSGYSEDLILKKGILEKGINFIFKPVKINDLLRNVREVLDK